MIVCPPPPPPVCFNFSILFILALHGSLDRNESLGATGETFLHLFLYIQFYSPIFDRCIPFTVVVVTGAVVSFLEVLRRTFFSSFLVRCCISLNVLQNNVAEVHFLKHLLIRPESIRKIEFVLIFPSFRFTAKSCFINGITHEMQIISTMRIVPLTIKSCYGENGA